MILTLEAYRNNKEPLRLFMEGHKRKESRTSIPELLSQFAVASKCPIIAVYAFYIELVGSSEELETGKQRLMAFYRCKGII